MAELLAVPQSTAGLMVELARLRTELAGASMDEVVAARLAVAKDWESSDDPVVRRFRRAHGLLFTDDEIENSLRDEIVALLPFLDPAEFGGGP